MPRRILLTRLRRIGDAILALPVVDALRDAFPDSEIDFLAEAGPAQAAHGHPAIDRVLTLRRTFPILPAPPGLLATLRARRYDCVIDLYGNPRTALLAAWTGAGIRIGPRRSGPRGYLYTHRLPAVQEPLSAVEHHLKALEPLGIVARPSSPRIHLTDRERTEGRARLDRVLPPGAPRVGIHPGNRWPAKRWPEERFSALIRGLPRLGAAGVVLAGPGEEPLALRVADLAGAGGGVRPPVIGGLGLRDYWGVLAALDVLVTVDGSPLHAGPALQVPTVGILGPTVPEIWFPYSNRDGHQLLCREIWCRPCHRHECARMDCLDWISVAEALRATRLALAHSGNTPANAPRQAFGTLPA
jgi:ADP-heptose:LPS heptosyltransferase